MFISVSLWIIQWYFQFWFDRLCENFLSHKMSVRPAKTQISLGIRPAWSESLLCVQWVAKDPRFLHADSEDSDQTGRMPRLIWVLAGRSHFVCFVVRRLILTFSVTFEQSTTKQTKLPVRPMKTQIRLGIHLVFAVRMKNAWDLSYPKSAQQRLWCYMQ